MTSERKKALHAASIYRKHGLDVRVKSGRYNTPYLLIYSGTSFNTKFECARKECDELELDYTYKIG